MTLDKPEAGTKIGVVLVELSAVHRQGGRETWVSRGDSIPPGKPVIERLIT